MPTPNNNNSITYFELALLAKDVYKKDIDNRGVNGWEPDVITGTANNFEKGLSAESVSLEFLAAASMVCAA
jgi:hypothetical protein